MKRKPATAREAVPSPSRARRTFSDAFKRDAVALAEQRRREGVSWAQIGRELDVGSTLLFQWRHDLERHRTRPAGASPTGLSGETLEDEVRRLRRENAILREEREFAKKAAAFFATGSR